MLGQHFEAEIREQPDVWRAIATSGKAQALAAAIDGREIILLGSGSSLFMAQLGALALRRRAIRAHALAATEAPLDHVAYEGSVVIAVSQSGQSEDLLHALDVLNPKVLIALTNTAHSPLGERASLLIDVGAGPEVAVPASKSVTATAAILLWAAGIVGKNHDRNAETLIETAEDVRSWLDGPMVADVRDAGARLAGRRSVLIFATGYGLPVAREFALKLKEASYIHAEGFSAGEFRHGSGAMLDSTCAAVGIVDDASRQVVNRPMLEAAEAQSLLYVIGNRLGNIPLLGPVVGIPFNTLAWLVAAQMIALYTGRARHVESDAPRGQVKVLDA
ncbi:MAG TPA: SIS domain-containing protein [Candidatus Baltobacteraceae bacterium]|nr:SIS domain-containing protein [Candidatus Baltobacteraceae bacterium]